MNKAHRNADCEIKRVLQCGLGQYLHHSELSAERHELYWMDGIHLAEEGLDIFLEDLQQGLRHGLGIKVGASV